MKLVFLDAKTVGDVPNLGAFESFGEFITYPTTSAEERQARIADADIIITNKVIIDKEMMTHAKKLKLICIAATGKNNIDLQAAEEKGIVVKNAAGYSTDSVAQWTFALALQAINKTAYYNRYVQSGEYCNSDTFTHPGPAFWELKGKTYGIVGLGNIGKKVAGIARAFGANVVYYSTSGSHDEEGYQRVTLDELLATADVVSIHAPLNDNTKNLIGAAELKRMKNTAILINVGRGGIVDEAALASALNSAEIAAAGLDVYEQEPMRKDNPLLAVSDKDRLIMLPHIAWASIEARTRLMDIVHDNIREFLEEE
jgi:glycerate dehydrogenase